MRRAGQPKPHKRDGIWYLVRRVPKEFAELDRRVIVRVSTDIAVADDPRGVRAASVVRQLSAELEAYWRGMRDGQSAEARLRFDAAQRRARDLGLAYRTATELAEAPVDEILRRIQLLIDNKTVDDEREVVAVLGGESRPTLQLSGLVEEYEASQEQALKPMSPNQLRRWRNPRKLAIANMIDVVGDKPLSELTRADGIAFRTWWQKRVVTENLNIGTANKDIGHISKMLRKVDVLHQLGLPPIFEKLRLEGEDEGNRQPFTNEHLRDHVLRPGRLDGLNEDARDILLAMVETGLRPSEVMGLTRETIHLKHKVPHVQVRAIGRKLKTKQSERDVPLVGISLEAMKRHPDGFPAYWDRGASWSALVNQYLDNHHMLPTEDHSAYSVRHSFEDRLTAVEAPEKVIATLMGHKWHRPKYGAGPSLEQKQRWLKKIAFPVKP